MKDKSNLILRVTEYGLKHEKFIFTDMKDELKLDLTDESFLHDKLIALGPTENPNHLIAFSGNPQPTNHDWRHYEYRLLPTAFYNYVDYLEIKEARKASVDSKRLSWIAITISIALTLLQIWVQVKGPNSTALLSNCECQPRNSK